MAKVPEYEDRLSKFERMCVVKTFREDRTLVAASEYVADSLGQRFVESVPLNMERAWAESHKRCPLICLLSRGSDPTKLIEDLAKRKKIKARLLHLVPSGRIKCTLHDHPTCMHLVSYRQDLFSVFILRCTAGSICCHAIACGPLKIPGSWLSGCLKKRGFQGFKLHLLFV